MHALSTGQQHISATISYFADTKAANNIEIPTENQQWQDVVYPKYAYKDVPVTVQDVRGREADFDLDTHGFQYMSHNFKSFDAWAEAQQVHEFVYPQVRQFLLEIFPQAADVLTFEHIHRHLITDIHTGTENHAPAKGAHVDATGPGALGVLRLLARRNPQHFAPFVQPNNYRRTQLVNVWMPLRPVRRDPLGVCDVRTVDYDKDIVEIKMSSEGIDFATCSVRPNGQHKWYYRSGMQWGDVLLLKIADCDETEQRTGVPHASFHVPGTEDEPARESVEIRSYIFYK